MRTRRDKVQVMAWRLFILIAVLSVWQWGYTLRAVPALRPFVPGFLDPYFVATPGEIWHSLLRLGCLTERDGAFMARSGIAACMEENPNNLWDATLTTLRNTAWGMLFGALSGVAVGLILGRSDKLSRIFEPYVIALNSIPRIALVPIIILMFGLGDMSKIVTAVVGVFFIIFFNTYEGARAVERDQIAVARLLGAGPVTILRTVVIPSALAWVFASLTPAVSFALVGVIVSEFIGAERGVGKLLVEAEGRASAGDMMAAIFVLMVVGILLAIMVRRVQAHLLRWQPQFEAQG